MTTFLTKAQRQIFRELCAELVDHLQARVTKEDQNRAEGYYSQSQQLIDRALIALAEPAPPADGEVAELVAWMRDIASIGYGRLARAADLLERLAPQPEPEGPTDDALMYERSCQNEGLIHKNQALI
jgi:hypothetical protein